MIMANKNKNKGMKRGLSNSFNTSTPQKQPPGKTRNVVSEGTPAENGTVASQIPNDTSDTNGQYGNESRASGDLQSIVERVLKTMQPEVIRMVSAAVEAAVSKVIEVSFKPIIIQTVEEAVANKIDVLKSNIRLSFYNNDRLEQYSRRETIRIHGLAEQRRVTISYAKKS